MQWFASMLRCTKCRDSVLDTARGGHAAASGQGHVCSGARPGRERSSTGECGHTHFQLGCSVVGGDALVADGGRCLQASVLPEEVVLRILHFAAADLAAQPTYLAVPRWVRLAVRRRGRSAVQQASLLMRHSCATGARLLRSWSAGAGSASLAHGRRSCGRCPRRCS